MWRATVPGANIVPWECRGHLNVRKWLAGRPAPVETIWGGDKAGVSALIDNLLAKGTNGLQFAAESSFDESALTWGLQAKGATASSFSGTVIRVALLDTGLDLNHPDFS